MIAGLGTDIVEMDRIRKAVEKSDLFAAYLLSSAELALIADWSVSRKVEFMAGRWAAKEAFAKALGTGLGAKCSFADLTILPDENGVPVLSGITGSAAETWKEKGIVKAHISISHERHYALATVLLER